MASSYHIEQSVYAYAGFPDVDWFRDYILSSPELFYPSEDAVVCPEENADEGEQSGISIGWSTVADAEFYVLQMCHNSAFQGPTLNAVRVTGNSYNLVVGDDVRLGDEIHFRVFAYNSMGGISHKSEPRSVKYECQDGDKGKKGGGKPNSSDDEDLDFLPFCERFQVKQKIDGPKIVLCCDQALFHAQYSWLCPGPKGEEGAVLTGAVWGIINPPFVGFGGNTIIFQNQKVCVVRSRCQNSFDFTLRHLLTFQIPGTLQGFTCQCDYPVTVDCHVKPNEKPWLIFKEGSMATINTYIDTAYWRLDSEHYAHSIPSTADDKTALPMSEYILVGPVVQISAKTGPSSADEYECGLNLGSSKPIGLEARVHIPIPFPCRFIDIAYCGALECDDGLAVMIPDCGGLSIDCDYGLRVDPVAASVIQIAEIDSIDISIDGCDFTLTVTVGNKEIPVNCAGVTIGPAETVGSTLLQKTISIAQCSQAYDSDPYGYGNCCSGEDWINPDYGGCVYNMWNLNMDNLPEITGADVQFLLAISADGCIAKVPVTQCY